MIILNDVTILDLNLVKYKKVVFKYLLLNGVNPIGKSPDEKWYYYRQTEELKECLSKKPWHVSILESLG